MKIMQETTVWENAPSDNNHIYVFAKYDPRDRMAEVIAYVPFGTEPVQKFKKPLKIDLKGRTFKQVA